MTPNRIILFFGPAVFLTLSACPSAAQIIDRLSIQPEAATIDALTKRIQTLEGIVAQLQQQTAFIKSVNPLVLDASGAAVTIRGGKFSLEGGGDFDIKAGGNATIRITSVMTVDAAAGLDLKGSLIKLNGGDRPVVCAGAMVNGATGSAGGGRLDHSHPIAVPLPACSATVLVPPQD